MDNATVAALVIGALGLIGSVMTALFAFRGGLPAAARSVAEGFSILRKEMDAELEQVRSELGQERQLRRTMERELVTERGRVLALEMEIQRLKEENIRLNFQNQGLEATNQGLLNRIFALEAEVRRLSDSEAGKS